METITTPGRLSSALLLIALLARAERRPAPARAVERHRDLRRRAAGLAPGDRMAQRRHCRGHCGPRRARDLELERSGHAPGDVQADRGRDAAGAVGGTVAVAGGVTVAADRDDVPEPPAGRADAPRREALVGDRRRAGRAHEQRGQEKRGAESGRRRSRLHFGGDGYVPAATAAVVDARTQLLPLGRNSCWLQATRSSGSGIVLPRPLPALRQWL